ncbi:MAG TPA: SLC13 family permease [Acidimicrobiia bacterium]
MTPEAWLTALIVVLILAGLVASLASPSVLAFSGVVILLLVGVIDPSQALSGFSNPAPFTVGALFVVARAISKSGAIRPFTQSLMGRTGRTRRPLLRMLAPTVVASAFMNNIPLVAMMIPEVTTWARKRGSDAARFLLPLSYGAIFGGILTLIGTSTNLVVAGQMEDFGLEPFSFFELGRVGLPIAVAGVVTLVALSPRFLKRVRSPATNLAEAERGFSIDMAITDGGPLDGITVEEGGLRHLSGVFLASVDRGDSIVAPARPNTVLRGGDRLRFVGRIDQVLDLQAIKGLEHANQDFIRELTLPGASYFTAAIGYDSPLVGMSLREAGFRSKYQAAVVAIHRAGVRLDVKLGDVVLRPGDALIVLTDSGFGRRWQNRADFLVISGLGDEIEPVAPGRRRTLAVLGAMVVVAATGLLPILHAAMAAALLMLVLRVLTPEEARQALDLDVLGVIAAAFGLATAVEVSGLADVVSDGLISNLGRFGEIGVLTGVVLATVALTELVTNNAAALLMFPIAVSSAAAAGIDPRGMAVAVAIAASASFLTPLGYQTNTMVYGPGGYRVSDYVRVGLPITVIAVIGVVSLVPLFY